MNNNDRPMHCYSLKLYDLHGMTIHSSNVQFVDVAKCHVVQDFSDLCINIFSVKNYFFYSSISSCIAFEKLIMRYNSRQSEVVEN